MHKWYRQQWVSTTILWLLLWLGAWLPTRWPVGIERYYSRGVYPLVSRVLRGLLGGLPFSLGDVLWGLLFLWLFVKLFNGMKALWKKAVSLKTIKAGARRLITAGLWGWLVFQWCWGFNYYRLGSRQLFGIQPRPYTTAQVDTLVQVAINNLNSLCTDTTKLEQSFTTRPKALATQAQASYNRASHQWPFLQFRRSSLKPHLIGRLQSYTGYAGYINPFTQEAQVNFYMPRFELPFTVCHEMAHQLGFGSESEANWIGFMACRSSASIAFAYSGYYQTTLYALSQLFTMDSTLAAQRKEQLPPVFLKHYAEMKAFGQAHQNPAQPFLNRLYDGYLRTQNQPEGVATYNQMVAWQIAYAQVYGWESLNWVGPAKTGLAE